MADSSALNAARRATDLTALGDGAPVDLLVIGGGVTGAGIALDAAARGLSVVLAEKRDLAFGTSRWSSKLVHGGLRYLATGNIGIARRSAAEQLVGDLARIFLQCLGQLHRQVGREVTMRRVARAFEVNRGFGCGRGNAGQRLLQQGGQLGFDVLGH